MQVTVSAKGQVVIPASIRKKLNIKKGATLLVREENGRIVLEPAEEALKRDKGMLDTNGRVLKYLLEERKREAEREEEKVRL